MKKILIISATFFLVTLGSAQQLTLTNGADTVAFPTRSIFQIISGGDEPSRGNPSCDYLEAVGFYHHVQSDSLYLLLTSLSNRTILGKDNFEQSLLFNTLEPSYPIALDDIYQLKRYKSKESMHRNKRLGTFGGMLIFTGAVTSLNSLVVKDRSNKRALLVSGGLQICLGVGLAVGSNARSYPFKGQVNNWRVAMP